MSTRNLVVCLDGTGNDDSTAGPESPSGQDNQGDLTTNVFRISQALTNNEDQNVAYFKGVGTSGWKLFDTKGYVAGTGANRIKWDALEHLSGQYRLGDRIFIFGFSRGAAIARDLVNSIQKQGLGDHANVEVKMLGLWDTVAAFGIPINALGFPTQEINLGKKLDIPDIVKQVYHLVAIDEIRGAFVPTLVEHADNVEEVWFAGDHADVGGGWKDRRLSEITLHFMIKRAMEHGLRFVEDSPTNKPPIPESPREPKAKNFFSRITGTVSSNKPRTIAVRKNRAPAKELFPKIHQSVFDMMNSETLEYDPTNIPSREDCIVVDWNGEQHRAESAS